MSRKLPDFMHWQIYQAYLRGPHALFQLFEDVFGRLTLYGQPDQDMQQREIDALSEHITQLKAHVERLQAQVSQLHVRNFRLQRRNAELESLLAKDSHNSSRPPLTDPPWAKWTRSLRRCSSRGAGGQVGHRGETLRLSAHPCRVVEPPPPQCRNCHASLAAASVVGHRRQQVWEVVPTRLKVTVHQLALLRCSQCGQMTRGEFSGAVRSYVPSIMPANLFYQLTCCLSSHSWLRNASTLLAISRRRRSYSSSLTMSPICASVYRSSCRSYT